MPIFCADDGTPLAFHVRGSGETLLCLPGGPMRASAYLGDLGGWDARRRLVMLDARGTGGSGVPADPATYRCDRLVDDVEALRRHLGLERMDLLAHSAAGDLALQYTARHPDRVRALCLITARARVLGIEFTTAHRAQAADLRAGEPWAAGARAAYDAVWAGTATDADFDAATPFFYGRWDDAARAHAAGEVEQTNDEATAHYVAPGAFEPPAAVPDVPVLVLAGELDSAPRPGVAEEIAGRFRRAEMVVQPGAGHYPWLDDPARFSGTVEGFLGQYT
ncbi:alpha/beta hydrolase [Streptomyces sp. PTM05]|uniref:Alpha/beta hydrolase n=1 Tax=Streptantibioticus parmotrematis TaxID=2873249 RepID=A0ABS7QPI3_9ACTN|nr:alpha/beta hydrolase [Streptantibioticus parmotrematis]MBY8885101.1 alpha/beta hydrolase [Streptantibioticus parmotrematis]